jgi:hypothetical protein
MNLKCVTALTLSVVAAFTSMILRAQSTVPAAPDNVPALSPPHKTITLYSHVE